MPLDLFEKIKHQETISHGSRVTCCLDLSLHSCSALAPDQAVCCLHISIQGLYLAISFLDALIILQVQCPVDSPSPFDLGIGACLMLICWHQHWWYVHLSSLPDRLNHISRLRIGISNVADDYLKLLSNQNSMLCFLVGCVYFPIKMDKIVLVYLFLCFCVFFLLHSSRQLSSQETG